MDFNTYDDDTTAWVESENIHTLSEVKHIGQLQIMLNAIAEERARDMKQLFSAGKFIYTFLFSFASLFITFLFKICESSAF